MIAPRFAQLVFAILMSIYMVTVMTFVITWVNTGMTGALLYAGLEPFILLGPSLLY